MKSIIDLRKIGASMSAERLNVPIANIPKFDVESQDHFSAISRAVNSGNYDEAERIIAHWIDRVGWLKLPNSHVAPPCLIRKPGESMELYLKRCYEAS